MQSKALTPDEYVEELAQERKEVMTKLRETIKTNLPDGFKEEMSYGMIGYVVPHELYPKGYHCTPKLPLPFINLASQKNFIALYHMGIYAGDLIEWFSEEWKKHTNAKLDMGKSCIRIKNLDTIPYSLIAELCRKISVNQWIELYENTFLKKKL